MVEAESFERQYFVYGATKIKIINFLRCPLRYSLILHTVFQWHRTRPIVDVIIERINLRVQVRIFEHPYAVGSHDDLGIFSA
jgi:hypothetical protein